MKSKNPTREKRRVKRRNERSFSLSHRMKRRKERERERAILVEVFCFLTITSQYNKEKENAFIFPQIYDIICILIENVLDY